MHMGAPEEVLLARQPICTASLSTVGYELLFRDASLTVGDLDATAATARVLVGAVADVGLDQLIGPHRAWLNVDAAFLHAFDVLPLPPERVVLEVLETVTPDAALLERLRDLRKEGFTLAADDFELGPATAALVPCVDVVKLDVRALGPDRLADHAARLRAAGVEVLAEKVETPEEFAHARDAGCTLFQGWFFCRPSPVLGLRVPTRGPASLSAVAELATGEADLEALERVVSLDAGLSIRLLRLLNSAALRGRSEVTGVRQALALLGERQARQWLLLVLLADLAPADHPLLETAIVRGRACELLAPAGVAPSDAFATGLLSVVDALSGVPMAQALADLPLDATTKAALLDGTGPAGAALAAVRRFEAGEGEPAVGAACTQAAAWASRVLASTS
jgi:c-di-GMP phosphodiesterase